MELCLPLARVSESSLSGAREQLREEQVEMSSSVASPEQMVRLAMVATALELIHSCCSRVGDEAVREELSLLSAELVRERAASGVAGTARTQVSLTTSNAVSISLQLSERLAASNRPNLLGGTTSSGGYSPRASPRLSASSPVSSASGSASPRHCHAATVDGGSGARESHRPRVPPPAAHSLPPPPPPPVAAAAAAAAAMTASSSAAAAEGALPNTQFVPTVDGEFRSHHSNAPAVLARADAHAHKSVSEAVSKYQFRHAHGPQMTSTHDPKAMVAAKERRRRSMAFGNQQSVANIAGTRKR